MKTPKKVLDRLPAKYGGWRINRGSGLVSFGCGAVTVYKSDLTLVAKNLEELKKYKALTKKLSKPITALRNLTETWKGEKYEIIQDDVLRMGKVLLEKIKG